MPLSWRDSRNEQMISRLQASIIKCALNRLRKQARQAWTELITPETRLDRSPLPKDWLKSNQSKARSLMLKRSVIAQTKSDRSTLVGLLAKTQIHSNFSRFGATFRTRSK